MVKIKKEGSFFMEIQRFRPVFRSFYNMLNLAVLIFILACVGSFFISGAKLKWIWIAAVVIDVLIFLYIAIRRMTISLTLKDDPAHPEDQEISFVEYNWLKPLSRDFKKSIEIGLANIVHIEVEQNFMQLIFRVGNVVVTSSGTGGREIFAPNMPNPNYIRDEIQKHARKYTMPAAPVQPVQPAPEAAKTSE